MQLFYPTVIPIINTDSVEGFTVDENTNATSMAGKLNIFSSTNIAKIVKKTNLAITDTEIELRVLSTIEAKLNIGFRQSLYFHGERDDIAIGANDITFKIPKTPELNNVDTFELTVTATQPIPQGAIQLNGVTKTVHALDNVLEKRQEYLRRERFEQILKDFGGKNVQLIRTNKKENPGGREIYDEEDPITISCFLFKRRQTIRPQEIGEFETSKIPALFKVSDKVKKDDIIISDDEKFSVWTTIMVPGVFNKNGTVTYGYQYAELVIYGSGRS